MISSGGEEGWTAGRQCFWFLAHQDFARLLFPTLALLPVQVLPASFSTRFPQRPIPIGVNDKENLRAIPTQNIPRFLYLPCRIDTIHKNYISNGWFFK